MGMLHQPPHAHPTHASVQHVIMHQHVAHPPNGADSGQGLIENLSDSLLNAFARVKKPDERFMAMREHIDKFEESLNVSERHWTRIRGRITGEYRDFEMPFCAASEAK